MSSGKRREANFNGKSQLGVAATVARGINASYNQLVAAALFVSETRFRTPAIALPEYRSSELKLV
jgi:hypothetical protein